MVWKTTYILSDEILLILAVNWDQVAAIFHAKSSGYVPWHSGLLQNGRDVVLNSIIVWPPVTVHLPLGGTWTKWKIKDPH